MTLGSLLWTVPARAEQEQALPALKVVQRFAVPPDANITDARWSGRDSVYLLYFGYGVAEVKLAEGLPESRRVVPVQSKPGIREILHLAASKDWLAVASVGNVACAPADDHDPAANLQVRNKLGHFQDLDVRGDTALLLGVPDGETFKRSGWEGVLWRADLSKGLDAWEVLYRSEAVAKDPGVLGNKLGVAMGSVRFLRNGDFVAAPNFLPGVLLFSSAGKLKKTWSPEELWGEGKEMVSEERGRIEEATFGSFLAAERVIDEVLALPEGPAIVVREPTGRGARWRLGVLGPEVQWYEIPVGHLSSAARLRGDADDKGRIVLVGGARELYDAARVAKSEVLVLELPDQ
jgi:hypothetical protein